MALGREMSTPPKLQWSMAHFAFSCNSWKTEIYGTDLYSSIDVSQNCRYERATDYEAKYKACTDVTAKDFAHEPRT